MNLGIKKSVAKKTFLEVLIPRECDICNTRRWLEPMWNLDMGETASFACLHHYRNGRSAFIGLTAI